MAGRDYWADLEDRLSYHGDPAQEELEIEFNARYDYLAEQAAEHADLADDYDDYLAEQAAEHADLADDYDDYLAEQAAEHADLADDYDDEPGEVVEVDYLGGIPF